MRWASSITYPCWTSITVAPPRHRSHWTGLPVTDLHVSQVLRNAPSGGPYCKVEPHLRKMHRVSCHFVARLFALRRPPRPRRTKFRQSSTSDVTHHALEGRLLVSSHWGASSTMQLCRPPAAPKPVTVVTITNQCRLAYVYIPWEMKWRAYPQPIWDHADSRFARSRFRTSPVVRAIFASFVKWLVDLLLQSGDGIALLHRLARDLLPDLPCGAGRRTPV